LEENQMNMRAFTLAALIAGVVMGVLSNFPIINFANCLLCMWVWLSAILAVFLYRRFAPEAPFLSVGEGAGLGAVAGIVGAVVGALVSLAFNALFASAGFDPAMMLQQLQSAGIEVPPEAMPAIQAMAGTGSVLVSMLCNGVVYAIFGAIGGIIAAALIWKKPQTPTIVV
jgi:hypothetical protein